MNLFQRIKAWRDRRFQKRVYEALGLNVPVRTGLCVSDGDIRFFGATSDHDSNHNDENGVPV